MRLWSIHPRYLDRAGLVALWREGLLAQAVLRGRTRGYRNHPQLARFREQADPLRAIAAYLRCVADEGERRGYRFDRSKIRGAGTPLRTPGIAVSRAQLRFELGHLRSKLRVRDREAYRAIAGLARPAPHPCFRAVGGGIAAWERR